MIYRVRFWGKERQNEVALETNDLKVARKTCKAFGHTGIIHNNRYEPVSFVSLVEPDGFEGVTYNPVFKVSK